MSQFKESGYVYLHTLDNQDILKDITKGVHKAYLDEHGDLYVWLKNNAFPYYLFKSQYIKVVPNKINKLLYGEVI